MKVEIRRICRISKLLIKLIFFYLNKVPAKSKRMYNPHILGFTDFRILFIVRLGQFSLGITF